MKVVAKKIEWIGLALGHDDLELWIAFSGPLATEMKWSGDLLKLDWLDWEFVNSWVIYETRKRLNV